MESPVDSAAPVIPMSFARMIVVITLSKADTKYILARNPYLFIACRIGRPTF